MHSNKYIYALLAAWEMRLWCSGNILASHARAPASIAGNRMASRKHIWTKCPLGRGLFGPLAEDRLVRRPARACFMSGSRVWSCALQKGWQCVRVRDGRDAARCLARICVRNGRVPRLRLQRPQHPGARRPGRRPGLGLLGLEPARHLPCEKLACELRPASTGAKRVDVSRARRRQKAILYCGARSSTCVAMGGGGEASS